jgi:hypothetical protein
LEHFAPIISTDFSDPYAIKEKIAQESLQELNTDLYHRWSFEFWDDYFVCYVKLCMYVCPDLYRQFVLIQQLNGILCYDRAMLSMLKFQQT